MGFIAPSAVVAGDVRLENIPVSGTTLFYEETLTIFRSGMKQMFRMELLVTCLMIIPYLWEIESL